MYIFFINKLGKKLVTAAKTPNGLHSVVRPVAAITTTTTTINDRNNNKNNIKKRFVSPYSTICEIANQKNYLIISSRK